MRHDNGYGKQEVRREVFDAAICSGGADEAECLCVSVALLAAEHRPACIQECRVSLYKTLQISPNE